MSGRQTERVASRIQEYPPASVAGLMVRLRGSKVQRQAFRPIEVVSAQIQVKLLWHILAWPLRSPISVNPLESKITAGVVRQSDELVRTEELAHPGQCTVEARQGPRVGTVQSHPSQFSAWQHSLRDVRCLRNLPLQASGGHGHTVRATFDADLAIFPCLRATGCGNRRFRKTS